LSEKFDCNKPQQRKNYRIPNAVISCPKKPNGKEANLVRSGKSKARFAPESRGKGETPGYGRKRLKEKTSRAKEDSCINRRVGRGEDQGGIKN